jgi:hypothetical protein
VSKKINETILLKIWPRNEFDKKDNAYKIPTLAYSQKKDQLIPKNNTADNEEEELRSLINL